MGVKVFPVIYERNKRGLLGKLSGLISNFIPFVKSVFGMGIFFISKYNRSEMKNQIKKIIMTINPDVIQMEYNVMHHYADLFPSIPKILIQHDISTKVYERAVLNNINSKSSKDYRIAQENENHWMNKFDAVVVLTEEDKLYCEKRWGKLPPISVIPPQVPLVSQNRSPIENKICFIGSFNREPNIHAFDILLKKIYPQIKKEIPTVTLDIAGKYLSSDRKETINKSKGVNYRGFVTNIDDFLSNISLLIAPIYLGAGLKMKITHALACGVPVLTTSVGAEGIPLTETEGLYVENDIELFIQKAVDLLHEKNLEATGLKGKIKVREIFSPDVIGRKFEYLYLQVTTS